MCAWRTWQKPRSIIKPTDAVVRTAVTCVCGSDLWPYRGAEPIDGPHPMGHEYVGFVEEVGSEVTAVRPGQFVVGSFATSDNTCAHCRNGFQSHCRNPEFMSTCQAEYVRIPNAQGTLVATGEVPGEEFWPGLLDHDVARLQVPPRHDLCRGYAVGLSDGGDRLVPEHRALGQRGSTPRWRCRVRRGRHAVPPAGGRGAVRPG